MAEPWQPAVALKPEFFAAKAPFYGAIEKQKMRKNDLKGTIADALAGGIAGLL
ncbi:MAG: hypothetical protein LBK02_03650 [Treponema sp.]|nr:hypothetical protein [Treponema sp.]